MIPEFEKDVIYHILQEMSPRRREPRALPEHLRVSFIYHIRDLGTLVVSKRVAEEEGAFAPVNHFIEEGVGAPIVGVFSCSFLFPFVVFQHRKSSDFSTLYKWLKIQRVVKAGRFHISYIASTGGCRLAHCGRTRESRRWFHIPYMNARPGRNRWVIISTSTHCQYLSVDHI